MMHKIGKNLIDNILLRAIDTIQQSQAFAFKKAFLARKKQTEF